IITAFSRGEVPDLRKLPSDLIEHFKSNSDKLGLIFNRVATVLSTACVQGSRTHPRLSGKCFPGRNAVEAAEVRETRAVHLLAL
ncbi:hypothetical protein ANCDUO_18460, partial [Ancylostoma duodenale]